MSKYNEQCTTTMLNALQGTDTLERYKQDIRTDVIDKIKKYVYRNIHFYDAIEQEGFYEFLEQLKEKKNEDSL